MACSSTGTAATPTVKDNWIYNTGAEAVKVIFSGNQNVLQSGNQSSSSVITPPFVAEVGPAGTASYGIVVASNKLTGSVIHYTDRKQFFPPMERGWWRRPSAWSICLSSSF